MTDNETNRLLSEFLSGKISDDDAGKLLKALKNDPKLLEELADLQDVDILIETLARDEKEKQKLSEQIKDSVINGNHQKRIKDEVMKDIIVNYSHKDSSSTVNNKKRFQIGHLILLVASIVITAPYFLFRA